MMNGRCNNWAMAMSTDRHNRLEDSAYVLHSRAYRNTSLLVEVFTRAHGRFSVVAKGARRPASGFYGMIQPFQPLFVRWGGHGELKTLYAAEHASAALSPQLSGETIYLGFYINELLIRLLHQHDEHVVLFNNYRHCLEQLAGSRDSETVLRYFELELLDELGYGLNLTRDYRTEKAFDEASTYVFHQEYGLTRLDAQAADDPGQQICVHGDTVLALAGRSLVSVRQRREAKQLLRNIIESHLNGRPLKTRDLLQQRKKFQHRFEELG